MTAMTAIDIKKRLNATRLEKREIASKLQDYRGGCSYQYECITNGLYQQLEDKHKEEIELLHMLGEEKPENEATPLQYLLAIVFIISLIVLIAK